MTYKISPEEVDGVLAASDDKQYEYFVKKVADWEEVWSISNGQRWGTLADDEETELLPVWPHPAFAEPSLTGGWKDSKPKSMTLRGFLDHCMRIERDGGAIAILHRANGDYLQVSAPALVDDIRAELGLYE